MACNGANLRAGRRALVALAAVGALACAGCGVKSEAVVTPRPLPFAILTPPQARLASLPIALARSEGRYAPAGLTVTPAPVPNETVALAELAEGRDQGAIVRQSQVLIARDRGIAVVSVASLDQAATDQPVLAVRVREAERDGEALRALLLPLGAAAARLRTDPGAGLPLLGQAKVGKAARRRLEGEIALAATAEPNQPYGYQDPATWSALAQSLYNRRQLIHDPTTLAPPYTNEYLPGQGI